MSLNVFKALGGFGVFGQASLLSGNSAPGGDSGLQDAAVISSIFLRTDNGKAYIKTDTTNTTADWVELPDIDTVTAMISSSNPSISWREPADVADTTNYADITAAETAANVADQIDGVTISADFRILFTDLTSGNENIYIVSGSSGAWTFTEDANTTTNGDEVYVRFGTNAGNVFTYNGTDWVVGSGSSITNELGYIRAYIGKSSVGNFMPNYTSTNFVTNSTSSTAAISALDSGVFSAIGNRTYTSPTWVTSSQSLTASIQALDSGINTDIGNRTYTANNYVTDGQSVTASIEALDAAAAEFAFLRGYTGKTGAGSESPTYASTNYLTQSHSLETAIGDLDTNIFSAIGNRTYTGENYVTDGQSITASIQALDSQLGTTTSNVTTLTNIVGTATQAGVTSATVIDSALCRQYNAVAWHVTAVDASTPTNKRAVIVYALHNGTSSVDATTTDSNVTSVLVVGTDPSGLTFNVTLTGTGASQNMNLSVTSSTSVNVKTVRVRI